MIKQYKKRPIVIKAMQFRQYNYDEVFEFTEGNFDQFDQENGVVHTLEGNMIVKPSDYIIKGVKGEFYPVGEEIFEKTYEEVAGE